MKTVVWLLVAIVVIGAGVYLWGVPKAEAPTSGDYGWQLTELPKDPAAPDKPRTGVALNVGGKVSEMGRFDGNCFVIEESAWQLEENEKSGVICWWGGGGSEVGVFTEGGRDVVKVGQLDEGNAEIPGFRGNFQTILEL